MSHSTGLGIGMAARQSHNPDHEVCYDTAARYSQGPGVLGRQECFPMSTSHDSNFDFPEAPQSTAELSESEQQSTNNNVSADISGGLDRHGTLLNVGAPPGRNAAELNAILGSSNARLRSGATLLPPPGQRILPKDRTAFEQARTKARVEVDLAPYSNVCVQGGYLRGSIKVEIRTRKHHKEPPMLVTDGKVRLIGFECISNEKERYPFYQCSTRLSEAAPHFRDLLESPPDADGFSLAREGEFNIDFSMHIPISAEYGLPKGVLAAQSGVAIRYIAMVSLKCKEFGSDKFSIAHFYRNCEVWPRLNPATILASDRDPLVVSTTKSSFMGGGGKVGLNVTLHRTCWVAGQPCTVKILINNDTKKIVKGVTLALIRSIIVFKPRRRLDTLINGEYIADPDACQTFTSHKQVAEASLEMGQRSTGARHQVSAKGWWTGVYPGERKEFAYSVLLPQGTLSVSRSQLLEVNYSLQVTLHGGPLQTLDAQVILPIRIINFLSIDPPPGSLPSNLTAPLKSHKNLGSLPMETDYVQRSPENSMACLDSMQDCIQDLASDDETRDDFMDYPPCPNKITGEERPHSSPGGSAGLEGAPEESVNEKDLASSTQTYDAVHCFVDPDYEHQPSFADLYYQNQHCEPVVPVAAGMTEKDAGKLEHDANESELPWPPIDPSTLRRRPNTTRSRPMVSETFDQDPQSREKPEDNLEANTVIESPFLDGLPMGTKVEVYILSDVAEGTESCHGKGDEEDPGSPKIAIDTHSDESQPIPVENEDIHARSLPRPPTLLSNSLSKLGVSGQSRDSTISTATTSTTSRYSTTSGDSESHGPGSSMLQHENNTSNMDVNSAAGQVTCPNDLNRPPLSVLGRTASGASRVTVSAHSVKERIKELEKRQKVHEA